MVSIAKSFLLIAFALIACSSNVFAQSGTLSGMVRNQVDGSLIPGVSIEIIQLGRTVETDGEGKYKFTNLPNGTFTVITHNEGYSDKAQSVTISGGAVTLDFSLSLKSISAEVTITASGEGESVFESFSSVNSVGATRISEKASTSVGEILGDEPGISVRSFGGGGTGRPIIRGQSGDRVKVLQDGIGSGSLGAQSGDHGEPISPFNLERLEVIKGPATLLYGSSAIGGVVNAVTTDENNAHKGFRGYLTGLGGTVNRQAGIAGGIGYGYKTTLFNLNLSSTREGDYRTPFGRVPNSGSRANGGSGGVGYFVDKVFIRGTVTIDRRRYGIPYAALFESGELLSIANGGADCDIVDCQFDPRVLQNTFANMLPPIPNGQIDIKMRRNNIRFVGGFRDLKGPITQGTFTVDFSDYRHLEIEAEDGVEMVATTFDNDIFSYRGIFKQVNYKKLSGQFGFEGYRRSYQTVGAESLIDGRVRQTNFAGFALQELSFERVSLQFGGRVETNRYSPENNTLLERNFTVFSGAVAVRFKVWKGGTLIASFSNSSRPPALEELFNNGPHVGTVTFEIGDQNLRLERSNGFELSFRQNSKKVRFNGSIFYNDIKNFIYLEPQDNDNNGIIDVDDGLPVSTYAQNDARFFGADARIDIDINENFGVFAIGDIVDAKLKNLNIPLVRIAPARLRIGADIRFGGLSIRPEVVFVAERSSGDIFTLETPTEGYGLFNLNGSYAFGTGRTTQIFTFGFHNLGDKQYRNHTNFIKYLTPEAGRGFKASYTVRFF